MIGVYCNYCGDIVVVRFYNTIYAICLFSLIFVCLLLLINLLIYLIVCCL